MSAVIDSLFFGVDAACATSQQFKRQRNMSTSAVGVRMETFKLFEDGLHAAEQLVNSLICVKRRFSFSTQSSHSSCRHSWPVKKRRLQKSVQFSEDKSVHIVEMPQDRKAIDHRWYQEDEYKKIKEENHKTLEAYTRVLGCTKALDESEYCLLGLETQISILILRMPYRNRQKKVVRSVLNLQQIQRNMKAHDAAALREMSLIISNQDRMKALKVASTDSI
jgi:hypothetical protein